jgi:hypothetical protein
MIRGLTPVGGRGTTGNLDNIDAVLFRVYIKEDPIRTNPAAPGSTFGCQPGNIAAERILAHLLKRGAEQALALNGCLSEVFVGALSDA